MAARWWHAAVKALEDWGGWVAWGAAVVLLAWLGVAELVREFGWSLQTLASFGPAATALTAAVALVIGVMTIRQKSHTDRREQWWKRVQWALDKATSGSESEQGVALAALTALLEDDTATPADATMLLATVDALGLLSNLLGEATIKVEDANQQAHQPAIEPEPEPDAATADTTGTAGAADDSRDDQTEEDKR